MGKPDTVQISQEVPIVHPIIKISEDHFRENTAFTDGRYRALEEQRWAYKSAEEIRFNDVVGFVFEIKEFQYIFNITKNFDRFKKILVAF